MAPRLPLPTLLSQVLVAFTVEFDNEFEHQTPHSTTISKADEGARNGPWLTSMAMYCNFMQYVGNDGVTLAELHRKARTPKLQLDGMRRWGYVKLEGEKILPTSKGRRARETWSLLFGVIETRWEQRIGKDPIDRLRASLAAILRRIEVELPDYLPILGYGMRAEILSREKTLSEQDRSQAVERATLATLLAKVLLAFTLHFERGSKVSLAIAANVLRVLNEEGVRVRDLPRISGVSKEALKMATGVLEKRGYVAIDNDLHASRVKVIGLTEKGVAARQAYSERLQSIEERWEKHFGRDEMQQLRQSLEALVSSPAFNDIVIYPDNWRAYTRKPETLPHYPMVLHRGGYPDGS